MVIVLCSRRDADAVSFAARHRERGVYALTCAELSQSGWRLGVGGRAGEPHVGLTAVIGGRRLEGGEIEGAITRLRAVTEEELRHIVPEDRPYVAAEMHAFLFAFLAALPCPVVNPPSPACLCGPNLRSAQWTGLARELQIPCIGPRTAGTGPLAADLPADVISEVTIVGERTLGACHTAAARWSRQLAQRAGVAYLRVRFALVRGSPHFLAADPFPGLECDETGAAMLECFGGQRPRW